MSTDTRPRFFKTQDDFRRWLARHHKAKSELIVGYYKVDSGKPSMTWSQSVDQALCYGWIDGVRRRIDDLSYSIRFTPRKPGSKWSDVNLKKVEVLKRKKLMRAAGLAAYKRRIVGRRAGYAYEKKVKELPPEVEREFRRHKGPGRFSSNSLRRGGRRSSIGWPTPSRRRPVSGGFAS